MAGIADQFAGLPIEELIVSPIVGMAKGQAKLNEVTWKYISEVAFVTDEKTKKTKARSLDVEMNRVVTDGATGEQKLQKIYSKVPMLPLVPLKKNLEPACIKAVFGIVGTNSLVNQESFNCFKSS